MLTLLTLLLAVALATYYTGPAGRDDRAARSAAKDFPKMRALPAGA